MSKMQAPQQQQKQLDEDNSNMMNNEFYNDDLYDYKDYFMSGRGGDDNEEDLEDEADEVGPLAIDNLGRKCSRVDGAAEYYDNDFDIDGNFQDENDDDMMMDGFFKKVDSLELVKPKKAKIIANYLFGELLGDGSYGKVKECLDVRNLCRRAVKIINLKTVSRKIPKGIQNVRKEISIMRRLNNRNVIKLYDVFEKNPNSNGSNSKLSKISNPSQQQPQVNPITGIPISSDSNFVAIPNMTLEKPPKLYIFMDYCMTSLEKLLKCAPNEHLFNWQANSYFKQLIDGLEYLHSIGIIHNDIKPGNLLITCDETLKICDFSISAEINLFQDYDLDDCEGGDNGLGDILNTNEHVNPKKFPIVQCTPMFQCPEMLAENLNERQIIQQAAKIDIWSSGVTLYQLTTGKLPFNGQTVHQIYENIRSNSYQITLPEFLDKNLQKLLRGMLNRDPTQRWSIHQIRESEWFRKKHPKIKEEFVEFPVDVLQNENGIFRMLQYLQKLCESESEIEVPTINVSQHSNQITTTAATAGGRNQNNDDNDDTTMMMMNYETNSQDRSTTVKQQQQQSTNNNNDTTKQYAQATKMKRNNCTIN